MHPSNWEVVFHVRVVCSIHEVARVVRGGPGLAFDAWLLPPASFCPGGCPGLIHRYPGRCPAGVPASVPVVQDAAPRPVGIPASVSAVPRVPAAGVPPREVLLREDIAHILGRRDLRRKSLPGPQISPAALFARHAQHENMDHYFQVRGIQKGLFPNF